MTQEDFEDTLRKFIRRKPFRPFVVERLAGEKIFVVSSAVVFGGGAATYVSPEDDWIEFACEDVRAFHEVNWEAASES
jgi:hypothetical protein